MRKQKQDVTINPNSPNANQVGTEVEEFKSHPAKFSEIVAVGSNKIDE